MQKTAVTPKSRKAIRQFVKEFRKLLEMEDEFYFPIVKFVEWMLPNMGYDYEIVPVNEMGNAYGVTNTGMRTMKIREDVYIRAIQGNPRDRFTLCHELGHFLMHTPERVVFARGDIPIYMDPEWQANVFAGELMAPYELVKNMSPEMIAKECGMSLMAATIQYKEYHKDM